MGPDAPSLHLVVIGSAMVEIVPSQMGRRLSEVEYMTPLPSGSAANFAGALGSLGVRVGFISRVGDDELGRWLIRELGERGIDTDFIQPVAGQLTPVSFAWMDQEGEKTFYFYRFPGFSDPMATLTRQSILREQVTAGRVFDFTEATIRNEPLRSAALHAAELARAAGREVCYAVNYRPASWRDQTEEQIIEVQRRACAAADIVVMNREEARLVSGLEDARRALEAIAEVGPHLAVVTMGHLGALVCADGEVVRVPAREVEVVYDIGAGDSFHAGLLAGHLAGMPPADAARFASDAAALRISRDASAPNPTFEEVSELSGGP
ncbi:MAG: PfkB family carbohydrate kinase [Armatimonadota bacterium]|nr:PfkB family carbohydrate kinase [Armatimonadota bacterium]